MDKWSKVKHFTKKEKWNDPDKMELEYLLELSNFRSYVNKSIIIHSGFRENSRDHKTGKCSDFHIEGETLLDQFLLISRFPYFNSIGVYPYWNRPGLHAAHRDGVEKRALWLAIPKSPTSENKGEWDYIALDKDSIVKHIIKGDK